MQLLKNSSRGFYFCFVLPLTLVMGSSVITHADSGPVTIIIKAGSLTESNPTNKASLKLSKNVQLASYSLPIVVTDARGSGSGWHLSITSTTFKITNDEDGNKDQLPTNASRVIGVSASCAANSTCAKPRNGVSYPLGVPAGKTPPAPVKFFDAAVNSGLGKFNLWLFVNVSIPAQTEPGIYSSTIFLTIANGP
jgi:hypothetical protein